MNIPREVADLLLEQRLCALSTCFEDRPHASLMTYTYVPEEDAAGNGETE